MTATRIDAAGELQILHPETGGYVPASALLQVEGGLLTALAPEQLALLSDIRDASVYLRSIETVLVDLRSEAIESGARQTQSNILLVTLSQIDSSLILIKNAVDTLEALSEASNVSLQALQTSLGQLADKLPVTLGAKLSANSLSVALASDSTVFNSLTALIAALTDGGSGSVYNKLVELSSKIPATLGAKIGDSSLSVALASDSTIFTSLSNILATLSGAGANTVYTALTALSAKLPASLGAKLRTESMSVALASDSTIFTQLGNILNALWDGGTNSALSYLGTIASAQFWKTPAKYNTNSPVLNAVNAATSSAAYAINVQAEGLILQNFFSVLGASAQFAVELRLTSGATSISDKTYYYRGDVASPFLASAGAYPGESPIIVPTQGHAQVVVHVSAIAGGGNVTTYIKEIK